MSIRNHRSFLFFSLLIVALAASPSAFKSRSAISQTGDLLAGRNVNMVSGTALPWGDPFLQRQNEPSIAVSTRNPLHILAGANDYRTVDMLIPYEELPGNEQMAATRDAWLGLYGSYDGGESWVSTLLPGFPQDYTGLGTSSPLKAYGTAADPVVRAGTSGMFYYAGVAFTRNQKENAVFVARLIDYNNDESAAGSPIKYIGASIIDKGNAGQFIDKPWLAVDIPRSGAKTVTIQAPGGAAQKIKGGNVYLAYTVFTGQSASNPSSRVYVARSLDCGATWEKGVKVSESSHVNQGVTIAVSPSTGYVYVAWRRFAHGKDGAAIMVCSSTDGGNKFGKASEAALIDPFDQGTSATSFRTNAYPAMAADNGGGVYLAWAQRKVGPGDDARIVLSYLMSNGSWSSPQAIDNHGGRGHQFMPALACSGGVLSSIWYDQRNDVSGHWGNYISDETGQTTRHTIDVRSAQADVGAGGGFGPSVQVSRYVHLLDKSGVSHQAQFNPPNYPMFKEGTWPFHGDYIDITPAPAFLPASNGDWIYNPGTDASPVVYAAWTDNRNVKPPKDGNWGNYSPPHSTQSAPFQSGTSCLPGQTSFKNQDVFMTSLNRGLIVGSPGTFKPLGPSGNKHTFVVFVKNTTRFQKRFKLSLVVPTGVTASFKQFDFSTEAQKLEAEVAPNSSISRTVFATATMASQKRASIRVNVEEMNSVSGKPNNGLKGFVVLNPDIENPDIENPDIENKELHNPDIENPDIENPDIENPDIENPDIENVHILNPDIENPDIENPDIINPDIENPDIENPDIENPDIENWGIKNPDIENPDIENPDIENGSIADYTWKVTNEGNTASAYAFKMLMAGFQSSQYPGFGFQLLIYRVHTTPAATTALGSCILTQQHHDELIANILKPIIFNPDIENPDIENPDIENPDIENASFWLAPGDEARITLRVYDPNKNDTVKFDLTATPLTGATTAQAVNSANEGDARPTPPVSTPGANPAVLSIWNTGLPNGTPNAPYAAYLVAVGGTPHYTWTIAAETLPGWLSLNPNTGALTAALPITGTYNFTVQVTDATKPTALTATKALTLIIAAPCTISRPTSLTGTATGGVGIGYMFTAGGASDSGGHPLEYRLELAPGQYSSWSSTPAVSATFSATGVYQIKAQARCATNPTVVSDWSAAKQVTIYTSVRTIQGHIDFNGDPVTVQPDALGHPAEIILSDQGTGQRFPSSPTYNSTNSDYSIPNIPEGIYGLEVRIETISSDGKHDPGEYDGITNNIAVPAGSGMVSQLARVQKLIHLTKPVDNAAVQHWPGPVFDVYSSPVLITWSALPLATYYRYRVDAFQSVPPYGQVVFGSDVTTTDSQVSLALPASAADVHYQFSLNAYGDTLMGKLMLEYVGGFGWDYRFRVSGPAPAPEINLKRGQTDIADGGSFSYGTCAVGTNTDVTFKIENTGSAGLTLSGSPIIVIGGTDAGEFHVQQQPTTPVLPGNTTSFILRFSPTSSGPKTASLAIGNNDSDENPYHVTITGNGGAESYAYVAQWGTDSPADGNLHFPTGVAVNGSGEILVADTYNYRIQRFDSTGAFLGKIGNQAYHGVAVDIAGNVYGVYYDTNCIHKYSAGGTLLGWLGKDGTGSTGWHAAGVNYNQGVQGVEDGAFYDPTGIAFDISGNMYVSENGNSRVQKFAPDGTFITKWGDQGTSPGQFYALDGIAVDSSGYVYTAELSSRVQKFTSDGIRVLGWGSNGSGNGQFRGAVWIGLDLAGNVYVTDRDNHRVQKFTPAGLFIAAFGSQGTGNGQFEYPEGVAVDSSGNVYVADSNNHRIVKFRKN